jgi:plastocyanin
MQFKPAALTVRRGDRITWVNKALISAESGFSVSTAAWRASRSKGVLPSFQCS